MTEKQGAPPRRPPRPAADLERTIRAYQEVLLEKPQDPHALHMLGVALAQSGRPAEAVPLMRAALESCSNRAPIYFNLGNVLAMLRRHAEAFQAYRRAADLGPVGPEAHEAACRMALEAGQYVDALESAERALGLRPDDGYTLLNRAAALIALARPEEALDCCDRAIKLIPEHWGAHLRRGVALANLGRHAEAEPCLSRAAQLNPGNPDLHVDLGNLYRAQGRNELAVASLARALELEPRNPLALTNLGFALTDLGRPREAIDALRRALALAPTLAQAHHALGRVMLGQGDAPGARDCLRRAVELKPDFLDAHALLATALATLQQLPEALAVSERFLERRPEDAGMLVVRLNCALGMCDWEKVESTLARIRSLPGGAANARAFPLLGVADDPVEHLAAARSRAAIAMRGRTALPPAPAWRHERIRVAYVSRDFFVHATAFLLAELLELHDRSAFEVYGVSFGPDDGSALRQRVLGAFDACLEAADRSDAEIAAWLREREIDIAVDLKGYTALCRPGIFACRPAPVQVSYLGYPGTMAAPFIDYLIADRQVIPEASRESYTEKIIYLPDSYQANDRRRRIAEHTPTRAEAGLPPDGFVFCCFNNNWKISAPVFDVWMRLLSGVPDSVLWLLEDNVWAAQNLHRAAAQRGVRPERLIFASRAESESHLARHRLADLFLDTLPCNAHTTASDALWAGLPVLTCAGRTFAARVAASLLNAVGLPELVTSSLDGYAALATELARSPGRAAALRARLTANREALPLFDTPRFCRHLESAYRRIWLSHAQGKAQETFAVERLP